MDHFVVGFVFCDGLAKPDVPAETVLLGVGVEAEHVCPEVKGFGFVSW